MLTSGMWREACMLLSSLIFVLLLLHCIINPLSLFGLYPCSLDPSSDTRPAYNAVEDNSHHVRSGGGGSESRPVPGGLPSLLSAARSFRPSLLLDPNYRRSLLRQLSGSPSSHTGEVTGFPANSTWGAANDQIRPHGLGDVGGDGYARHSPSYHGSQVYGGTTHRDAESPVYQNDAEEEMIRAAIEASKKDFQEGRDNV